MRSLIRSILTFFALGTATVIGCNKSETPAGPADVVLVVPGMF
jgi:hypothetical protein